MQARIQLKGQPIHPLIAAYPLALFTTAAAVDASGRQRWRSAADVMIVVGLFAGAAAMLTGLGEASAIPDDNPAKRMMPRQALAACTMLAAGKATLSLRRRGEPLSVTARALSILAAASAIVAAWTGNRLVYREGIGVRRLDALRPLAKA